MDELEAESLSLDHVEVHLVNDVNQLVLCHNWLITKESIALDTETQGLDVINHKVRILQIGDSDVAWVFPIEGPDSWAGPCLRLLRNYTGRIVYHNMAFDLPVVRNTLGWHPELHRVADTMLMSRVLEPTRSAALKRLAGQLVDPRALVMDAELHDAMKASGYEWSDVPLDFATYWFYGGVDTILTHRVYEILKPQLAEGGQLAYELELATSMVCEQMTDHGAKVDRQYARENFQSLHRYVDDVAQWCESEYGVKPGSNAKIVEVLEAAGYQFIKLTGGGAKALDKEVLTTIDHPLAQAVLSRRQAQKIANTYLRHFIEEADDDDRIHPRINTCEAKTGRMSMDTPNLQNLPRSTDKNPLAMIVRNCIIPAEDHVLLMCDFDQIEWRLFASLSEDEALMAAFNVDDFFTEICRQVFNDPSIQKSDPRRQIVKNAMYARIYGAGTEKFAWTAGITVEDARVFTALLDNRYPSIRALQSKIDMEARHRFATEGTAYVYSPLTRRRYVIDDNSTYKLVNYLFQGVAAEVLKMKLVELDAAGLGPYMVCPVHDEVIMEVPKEDFHDIAVQVHEIMNDATLFAVPLSASVSHGARWGAKSDYPL